MRTLFASTLIAALWAPTARAAEPRAVVEKALAAIGGAEKLARFAGERASVKGTVTIAGQEVPMTGEALFAPPDSYRTEVTLEVAGMKTRVRQSVVGGQVDVRVAGQKATVADPQADHLRANVYSQYVLGLAPLLKDPQFQLAELPDEKEAGKELAGVEVKAKGRKTIKLYFDKASGLLTRIDQPGLDPATQEEVAQKTVIEEYREFDGIKRPFRTTVYLGGQAFLKGETTYRHLERVSPDEFKRDE